MGNHFTPFYISRLELKEPLSWEKMSKLKMASLSTELLSCHTRELDQVFIKKIRLLCEHILKTLNYFQIIIII
jgi:hypothetical protein